MDIDNIVSAYKALIDDNHVKGSFFVESIDNHGLTEKGLGLGYSFTKEEVETLASTLSSNGAILAQLAELDKFVSRETEDLIIAANTDSFLVGKANEKKVLRSQLV